MSAHIYHFLFVFIGSLEREATSQRVGKKTKLFSVHFSLTRDFPTQEGIRN